MLTSTNRRIFSLLAAYLLLTVLVFAAQAEPVTARALPAPEMQDPGDGGFSVYLPLISHQPDNKISGRVTYQGNPAKGIVLTLEAVNDAESMTLQQTTTATDGTYLFTGLNAAPPSGYHYEVWYDNGLNGNEDLDKYLYYWTSEPIQSIPNKIVTGVNFDIADVVLNASASPTKLPVTFTWNKRSMTSDQYYFDLFQIGSELEFISSNLKYTNSYELKQLPTGFSYGTQYCWSVIVTNAAGGFGVPYYCYYVTFQSGSSSSSLGDQPQQLEQANPEPHREILPLR